MNSKSAASMLLACGFVACGYHTHTSRDRFFVGFLPEIASSAALWPDQNTVAMTNRPGHAIAEFSLASATHVQSLPLARIEDDQTPLPSADSAYFAVVSGYGYAIQKPDGTSTVDPEAIPGYIKTAAFAPSQGHLALLDDAQNLVLATISSAGDVTGTWLTKTQLPSKEWAVGATMLSDGTLALVTSGSHVAVVDVAASVQGKAWKETDVSVPSATDLRWIAGIDDKKALVLDAKRLVVLDVKAGTVVDQKDLGSANVLGTFRDLGPHVVSQTGDEQAANKVSVTYVDSGGKLKTASVPSQTSQLAGSFLDQSAGTVAMVYAPNAVAPHSFDRDEDYYAARQIQRYQLASGSAVDTTTIDERVALTLRPSALLGVHPSALGDADIQAYGPTPATTSLSGYDTPVFTKQFAP